MPKLTIDAITCHVNVQDPNPIEGVLSIQAVPGTPASRDISWSQFQRLRDQLTSLEEAGVLFYTIEATAKDTRAESSDLVGLPNIDLINTLAKPFSKGAGVTTGAILTGTNLHGGQTKADVVMGAPAAPNGHITFEAIIPGTEGNDISVEFLTGGVEAVGVAANKISVTLNTGVSTYSSIEASVNGHAAASLLVKATKGGTGADIAAIEDETHLANGQGGGIALTLGALAAIITEVADDGLTITFTFDVSTLTAGDTILAMFRSGAKINRWPIIILA
jgi:hypothetical protein